MISKAYPRANTRALFSAAMAGSALGLGLAAAYLAGANSVSGLMHVRARALATAEAQGFSDAALQRVNSLSPGALAIAERHDPLPFRAPTSATASPPISPPALNNPAALPWASRRSA